LPRDEETAAVGHLGPDILGADWDRDEAVRRVASEPDRELGQALLDQRNLAGIGNLYKTESCFLAGLSPWTRVGDVPDVGEVIDIAVRLLTINREHPWQITTGIDRRGQQHYAFERSGKPCLRCRTPIRLAEQGPPPYQRLAYWCPRCQPGPAPRPMRPPGRPVGRTRSTP
ncbi:MAG: zinc finger domain-containing protein, partial [Actinomycetes bacterium]